MKTSTLHADRQIKEITYKCSKCKAEQVLRHGVNESSTQPFPCNKCKAGFGVPLNEPMGHGMYASKTEIVED